MSPLPTTELNIVAQDQTQRATISWLGIALGTIGGATLIASSFLPWWVHTVQSCSHSEQVTLLGGPLAFMIGGVAMLLSLLRVWRQRSSQLWPASFTFSMLLLTIGLMPFPIITQPFTYASGWYLGIVGASLGLIGALLQWIAVRPPTLLEKTPFEIAARAGLSLFLALAVPTGCIIAVLVLSRSSPASDLGGLVIIFLVALITLMIASATGVGVLRSEAPVMSPAWRRAAAFGSSFALCQGICLFIGLVYILSFIHPPFCDV